MSGEAFADGSNHGGDDFEFDRVPASQWLDLLRTRPPAHVIPANPSAARVHRAEAGAPWRRAGEEEVQRENDEAKVGRSFPRSAPLRLFGHLHPLHSFRAARDFQEANDGLSKAIMSRVAKSLWRPV